MNKFVNYRDQGVPIEERLRWAFDEIQLPNDQRESVVAFLHPLKIKDRTTYEHSIRVGLLARRIARFMHLDEKALLYAGLLHDISKAQTRLETLQKTESWTAADTEEIMRHVIDGYRLVRNHFDFSAEVILWHHRFQAGGYPKELPAPLHEYSEGTKTMIAFYGRILALADCFDALHRVNDKFGSLTGEQIKEKMVTLNRDQRVLVEELYNASVLTTYVVSEEPAKPQFLDIHDQLYLQIWERQQSARTTNETVRHIMLAAALEPLSDKAGCTTRHRNLNRWQKLEYFIAAAIGIGDAFHDLLTAICSGRQQLPTIYQYALTAQKESKRNRRGGRVNQGIIELLLPIVVAQHVHNLERQLKAEAVLAKAMEVLKQTSVDDIRYLREMKRFAFDLSGYFDRPVPEYSTARTVFEYYEHDLGASTKQTSIAHNAEFVRGFPTVIAVYKTLCECQLPELNSRAEEAYQRAAALHHDDVANGFLADCVAVGLYLQLSDDPKCKLVS